MQELPPFLLVSPPGFLPPVHTARATVDVLCRINLAGLTLTRCQCRHVELHDMAGATRGGDDEDQDCWGHRTALRFASAGSRGRCYIAAVTEDPSSELARLLVDIGWSQRELARRLNVTESTARSWCTGRRTPHDNVLTWLRDLAARLAAGPRYPDGWERTEARC